MIDPARMSVSDEPRHDEAPRAGPLAEDWLLVGAFALFPVFGLALTGGQGLMLLGVAILLWTGHRAPVSERLRDAHRAGGLAALLSVSCLVAPRLSGSTASLCVDALRVCLTAALACALIRGRPLVSASTLAADRVAAGALAIAGLFLAGLWIGERHAAFHFLAVVTAALGVVFGLYRTHLVRSRALPLLTRTALIGVAGAVLVVGIRA